MAKVKKIGITGGIACGKSSVANFLRSLGFLVVDADQIIAKLYGDNYFQEKVLSLFPDFPPPVTKQRMKEYLSKDSAKLSELELLIHPLVEEKFFELASNAKGYFFYEASLILEKNLLDRFDHCFVLDCPIEIRYERFKQRHLGENRESFFKLVSKNQLTDPQRAKMIQENKKLIRIDTSKNFEDVKLQILEFLKTL